MKRFDLFLKELKKFVKKEKIKRKDFAIFGSGLLAVLGLRDSRDIDVIVRPRIFKKLCKKYKKDSKGRIRIGHIQITDNWKPWFRDVNILIDTAELIKGIRYVKLHYVIEWKEKFNRKKDRKDLALIKKHLEHNFLLDLFYL